MLMLLVSFLNVNVVDIFFFFYFVNGNVVNVVEVVEVVEVVDVFSYVNVNDDVLVECFIVVPLTSLLLTF